MQSNQYVVPGPTLDGIDEPVNRGWPISVWLIPDILLAVLLTLIISVILLVIYAVAQAASGGSFDSLLGNGTVAALPPSLLFVGILVQNICFAGVVLLRTRVIRKLPLRWLGFHAPRPWRLAGLGVLFGIAFFALNYATGFIAEYFGLESADQAQQFNLQQGDIVGQILLTIGATVVAPIFEELFFRGYMFKALRESGTRRAVAIIAAQLGLIVGLPLLVILLTGLASWTDLAPLVLTLGGALVVALLVPSMRLRAYLVSAALFAVVHLSGITQGATSLMVAIFLGGLVLAAAFDFTDSLLPGIIAHSINNSVAFAQLLYCVNVLGSVERCG